MNKKQVVMVMPSLKGGGAERVASILVNKFYENGYDCSFVLTSCNKNQVIQRDLNDNIPVITISEFSKKSVIDFFFVFLRVISSLLCKPFEALGKRVPVCFSVLSFISNYHKEIYEMKKLLKKNENATVVAFLQPAIPIVLLAGRKLKNRMSETHPFL